MSDGFWYSFTLLIVGGVIAVMALRALGDRDWIGALIMLGISSGLLVKSFA